MVLWEGQVTSCFGDLYSFDCLKRGVWEHCHFEHDRSLQRLDPQIIFFGGDIVLRFLQEIMRMSSDLEHSDMQNMLFKYTVPSSLCYQLLLLYASIEFPC